MKLHSAPIPWALVQLFAGGGFRVGAEGDDRGGMFALAGLGLDAWLSVNTTRGGGRGCNDGSRSRDRGRDGGAARRQAGLDNSARTGTSG